MALAMVALAAPASADAGWLGVYRHDVTLAQTRFERGWDVKAGWIGKPVAALPGGPRPHALVSVSLNGETNYVAAGLNWTFGARLYARPGIGIAAHDGPSRAYRKGRRVDLGSPILFEPELALGLRLNEAIALEASWIHLSHATLFSRQNRGLDSWGLRAVIAFR